MKNEILVVYIVESLRCNTKVHSEKKKKNNEERKREKNVKQIKSLIGNVSTITICDDRKSIFKFYSLKERARDLFFFCSCSWNFSHENNFFDW